jgi:hypothetical protein
MSESPNVAAVMAQLRALEAAAKGGASEDEVKLLVATMAGDPMIVVEEIGGGSVHVKISRVRSVGPRFGGGTVLDFDGLPLWHPKRTLEVSDEQHKVVRRLRDAGWKY